jgi:diaminohydroxyphosphoribosylaminopyrimidine deaminase / 5-amino-6-(5-phosphoribosylamino)uracil reductase
MPARARAQDKTAEDVRHLRTALTLAERGRGTTHPNPKVGAVVVSHGRVVGRGWHRRAGGPHAEVEALREAGARARGATLYVTLEPCNHFGRTPPCVDKVIESGIRRVVVAVADPNPRVRGRGVRALRRQGVVTEVGILEREARALNAGYFKFHARGLPWVTLKLAASLDGKLAPRSRRGWLTGREAVRAAHALRAGHDAVVVGADTVRVDDPELTVRAARGDDPLRVVVSASLDLPARARLFRAPLAAATVVATVAPSGARAAWERRRRALEARGVRVWTAPGRGTRVPLRPLFAWLAEQGAHDVLVEGGGRLAGSLLAARLADQVKLFTAPLVLGAGVDWAEGVAFETGSAPRLTAIALTPMGHDWLVSGRVEYGVHRDRRGGRPRHRRGRA